MIIKTNKNFNISDIYTYQDKLLREETHFTVFGRITASRNDGLFFNIEDDSGNIQCSSFKFEKEDQDVRKNFKLGNIVLIQGKLFFTLTKHLTIQVLELIKCINSHITIPKETYKPKDKVLLSQKRTFFILSDINQRLKILIRFKLIELSRLFMRDNKTMEVDTPILHKIYGGAFAKPFTTFVNSLNENLYLRISPEIYLKRLLISGMPRVFEVAQCFRNEGISSFHQPEFTMIEAYFAFENRNFLINLLEKYIEYVCNGLINYLNCLHFNKADSIFFKQKIEEIKNIKWEEKKFYDIIFEINGSTFDIKDIKSIEKLSNKIDFPISSECINSSEMLEEIISKFYIKRLKKNIHITDYPSDISPLAKQHKMQPEISLRFESYLSGIEIANGFEEQNDPKKQKDAFIIHNQVLKKLGMPENEIDSEFINDMMLGMPEAAGIGIGIDRLAGILTNSDSFKECLPFNNFSKQK